MEIDPTGLRIALRRISSRYDIPIMITENGLGEYDSLTENRNATLTELSILKIILQPCKMP